MKERRCYRIEVFTPYTDKARVEYYSTCDRTRLHEYADNILDEVIWATATEYYWRDVVEDETQEEFADRIAVSCGLRFFDVSMEEWKMAECATFSFL